MEELTRRDLNKRLLQTVSSFALLRTLYGAEAFAAPVAPVTERWLRRTHELAGDLRGQKITPVQWQDLVEQLFAEIELKELLRFVDFNRLERSLELPKDEAATQRVRFPELSWLPEERGWGMQVFGLRKGAAVAPHGHQNMVSMHTILKGKMRVRHYERLRDEPGHLVLRPSIDRLSVPGDSTTISDDRDNVHWLAARSDGAFTLDVVVSRLRPELGFAQKIVNVDPARGEKLEDGLIRARIISHEEALKVYSNGSNL